MNRRDAHATADAVRPPARDRPPRAHDDPLAGWDQPGHDVAPAGPPPEWAVVAGTAVTGAVVGVTTRSDRRTRLGAGVRGLVAGALLAIVALRPWRREPEDESWARALAAAGRNQRQSQP